MPASSFPPNALATYRRLLSYIRAHWAVFILAVIGMMLYGVTDSALAALMKPMLDSGFVEQDAERIRWVAFGIVGIFLVRGVAGFLSNYLMARIGWRVITRLRAQMFAKILSLPTQDFDATPSGELISKLTYNVQRVAKSITRSITTVVRDSITVIALLGWMLYLNATMAIGTLIIAPLVGVIIQKVSARFQRINRRIQNQMGDVTHVIEEAVGAQQVIKIFDGHAQEVDRFAHTNERVRRFQLKLAKTRFAAVPTIQFLLAIVLAGVIYLSSVPSVVQASSVGAFVSFFTAMTMLLAPIQRLTKVTAQLQKGIAAGESVFALLDSDSERDTGERTLERATGAVDYSGVSFAYRGEAAPVLQDIDLAIRAGETVALVGRSGSGKTTLANLLPRLHELEHGQIAIDGIDVRSLTLSSLRAQIAYVGQTVTLFDDTVANNIAFGGLESASRSEIEAAARAAFAADFIERLPAGFDTQIGQDGTMLSGGQRQRLAVARAILKDAPILVLDEATSALDTESEQAVQAGLQRLIADRTTLVIAHRLSTIESADRILVMDAGRILEQGTHNELLRRGGVYAELHRLQQSADAPVTE